MKRLVLGVLFILLGVSLPANAQSVDFVYGTGKAFDIPSGTWMNFHVPAVEVSGKGLTLNIARMIDFNGHKSETDFTLTHELKPTERLTIRSTVARWRYHFPFTYTDSRKADWRWFVETRYRIKK